jgi:uncharacterized protein (TIGR03437 family)
MTTLRLYLILLFACAAWTTASAQSTATIDIDTTSTTPIRPGFAGVNDEIGFPIEYWDYRFNALAAKIGYGWLRFPGGNTGDIYNWQTGQEVPDWFAEFAGYTTGPGPGLVQDVAGKGGGRIIDAANRANLFGASLIICANAFTDTPDSIGKLAAYVKANQIPVVAWELANEAYLYPGFFPTSTAYLDKMKPYRDAIKTVDANAIVAVFVRDPGTATAGQNPWDQAIAAYPNKYWDAITFHHYPPQSTGTFAQWMADEATALANKTNLLVVNQYTPIGPAGVKFLVTEFDPSLPNDSKTGAASITDGTLWGGIYAAEFLMRMSTLPSMLYVGPHSIVSSSGVLSTNDHYGDVRQAGNKGTTIDTLSLDFGFYLAAQANGVAVLNGAINRATQGNKTTVTGGATVPATGITAGVPALYAMSYSNASGGLSLVIANKSATPHQTTVRVNGSPAAGPFPTQFVTGTDPSAANTPDNPNAVAIQTGSSVNPVTVPPYSVLRVDLKTPAAATFVNSASFQPVALAPQQLVTAFGSGFSSQTIVASDQPLPPTLGDTSIVITDSKGSVSTAPLYYVSPGQASFLIPNGVAAGLVTVKVERSGATVLSGTMTIAAVSPGLYSANGNGAGVAAALAERVDASGAVTPLAVFSCQSGIVLSCLSSALPLGATTDTLYVSLYGTGIRAAKSVQVFAAGQQVQVLFGGAQGQYQGLDQVNISIPRALAGSGEASVYVVADGKTSNMTTIKIQ